MQKFDENSQGMQNLNLNRGIGCICNTGGYQSNDIEKKR